VLEEHRRRRPESSESYVEAARLDLTEAAWAARAGGAALPLLAQALADAEHAVKLDGQLAEANLTAAKVCLQIATAQPSRAMVERGIGYLDQAVSRNPRLAKAQALRAALVRLRAR
jgi:hypothetical protein